MKAKRKLSKVFMIIGFVLVLAAAGLFAYNAWDENRAAQATLTMASALSAEIGDVTNAPPVNSPEHPMMSIEIDGQKYIGVIAIPVLDLSLPVIQDWSYDKLKIAPCRFVGTAFNDTMIIAAHNYTKHFGNIGLLSIGDEVIFTDVEANQFRYSVAEIETLQSSQVEEMVANDYDLTLFTCTYGGASRVTVRCTRSVL